MTEQEKEILKRAAAIMERVAEPDFAHTNEAGALFVEAKQIVFRAAGVPGYEVEPSAEQDSE